MDLSQEDLRKTRVVCSLSRYNKEAGECPKECVRGWLSGSSAVSVLFPVAAFAQANAINIVLDAKNFTTSDWPHDKTEAKMPLTWRGCKAEDVMSRLNKVKPDAVTAVPDFRGGEQWYGYLKLGNFENNTFYFVMDVISPKEMRMFFDINNNGRLDDDGPALVNVGKFNEGDSGFATRMRSRWRR